MECGEGPSLVGKVALVTGASRGIGRAIAQRFASAGATVVVAARTLGSPITGSPSGDAGTLHETVDLIERAGGRALPLCVDLADRQARSALCDQVVELAGGLDILVNNAGTTLFAPSEVLDEALFDLTIDQYVRIPFFLAQAALPHMAQRGAGWIVNVGSVAAMRPLDFRNRVTGDVVYAACKAALARMTQGLAAEYLSQDVAVNLVAPSTAIRTPGAAALIPDDFPAEPVEYLAETALALAHRPASRLTGQLAYSMHFPLEQGLKVRTLDNRTNMPDPVLPEASHPDIAFFSRPLNVGS